MYTKEQENYMVSHSSDTEMQANLEDLIIYQTRLQEWIRVDNYIGYEKIESRVWSRIRQELVRLNAIDSNSSKLTEVGLFCLHMERLSIRSAILLYMSLPYGECRKMTIIASFLSRGFFFLKTQEELTAFYRTKKYENRNKQKNSSNIFESIELGDITPILVFYNELDRIRKKN